MADQLGYSRQRLSTALHQNDISRSLSKALFEQFCLRITPLRELPRERVVKRRKDCQTPMIGPGRTPGAGRGPRQSKLDPHVEAIVELLANGVSQKEIARCYGTTPSNLHHWLKKRGLK